MISHLNKIIATAAYIQPRTSRFINQKIYCMPKIYYDTNQCDASVQYFAILHAVRETLKTKNAFTLSFTCRSKYCNAMKQSLKQQSFVAR